MLGLTITLHLKLATHSFSSLHILILQSSSPVLIVDFKLGRSLSDSQVCRQTGHASSSGDPLPFMKNTDMGHLKVGQKGPYLTSFYLNRLCHSFVTC